MNNKLKLAPIFAVFVKLSVHQDQVFSTTFLHLSFNHAVMMILFDFFQPYNREVCFFYLSNENNKNWVFTTVRRQPEHMFRKNNYTCKLLTKSPKFTLWSTAVDQAHIILILWTIKNKIKQFTSLMLLNIHNSHSQVLLVCPFESRHLPGCQHRLLLVGQLLYMSDFWFDLLALARRLKKKNRYYSVGIFMGRTCVKMVLR